MLDPIRTPDQELDYVTRHDAGQVENIEDEWEDGWGEELVEGLMPQTGEKLEMMGYNANVTDEDGCGSVFMMMGRREYMEDNYAMFLPYKETPGGSEGVWGSQGEVPGLFGVFDGHGGANCSQYCRDHLLVRALEFNKGSGVEEECGGKRSDHKVNDSEASGDARDCNAEEESVSAGMAKDALYFTSKVDEARAMVKASKENKDGKGCVEGSPGKKEGLGQGVGAVGSLWSRELSSRWLKQAMQYAFTETDREVLQQYPVIEVTQTSTLDPRPSTPTH